MCSVNEGLVRAHGHPADLTSAGSAAKKVNNHLDLDIVGDFELDFDVTGDLKFPSRQAFVSAAPMREEIEKKDNKKHAEKSAYSKYTPYFLDIGCIDLGGVANRYHNIPPNNNKIVSPII